MARYLFPQPPQQTRYAMPGPSPDAGPGMQPMDPRMPLSGGGPIIMPPRGPIGMPGQMPTGFPGQMPTFGLPPMTQQPGMPQPSGNVFADRFRQGQYPQQNIFAQRYYGQ